MQTFHKNIYLKLFIALILTVILGISFQSNISLAGNLHQTIPTAPPTTAINPTSSLTQTPTNPTATFVIPTISSSPTLTSIQPTFSFTTTTPAAPIKLPTETITSQSTETPLHNNKTVPVLTKTLVPEVGTQGSPDSSFLLTSTELPTAKSQSYTGIINCLLGGVIILILVIGIVWFLRTTRK
jgi:hypothetical protein